MLPPPTFSQATFGNRPFVSLTIDGYSGNLPQFQTNAAATGHILPVIDPDGILRRVPIFIQYDGGYYDSLSVATLRTFLDNAEITVRKRD
ncbi:MAG: CHASE2 domain-containing protein, partial [Fluviibacter sp.]